MAAQRATEDRLKTLRNEISRDAAELRRRWRTARTRVPQEWREALEVLWLLLRRRGPTDSTPPPTAPS